jgi:hypothetical protein
MSALLLRIASPNGKESKKPMNKAAKSYKLNKAHTKLGTLRERPPKKQSREKSKDKELD